MAAITELLNGSPLVSDKFTSYTMKHLVIVKNRHCTKEEVIKGTEMWIMLWKPLHPSMEAASTTSADTLMKPAT